MSFVKEQVIQSLATIDGAQPADPVPSLEVAVTLKCPNSLVTLVSFSGKRAPSWSYPDYPPSTMSHLPKVERKKERKKAIPRVFRALPETKGRERNKDLLVCFSATILRAARSERSIRLFQVSLYLLFSNSKLLFKNWSLPVHLEHSTSSLSSCPFSLHFPLALG